MPAVMPATSRESASGVSEKGLASGEPCETTTPCWLMSSGISSYPSHIEESERYSNIGESLFNLFTKQYSWKNQGLWNTAQVVLGVAPKRMQHYLNSNIN